METDLHKITLDDKMAADNILKSSDRRFCEYTFGNMYCWGVSALYFRRDTDFRLSQNRAVLHAGSK